MLCLPFGLVLLFVSLSSPQSKEKVVCVCFLVCCVSLCGVCLSTASRMKRREGREGEREGTRTATRTASEQGEKKEQGATRRSDERKLDEISGGSGGEPTESRSSTATESVVRALSNDRRDRFTPANSVASLEKETEKKLGMSTATNQRVHCPSLPSCFLGRAFAPLRSSFIFAHVHAQTGHSKVRLHLLPSSPPVPSPRHTSSSTPSHLLSCLVT